MAPSPRFVFFVCLHAVPFWRRTGFARAIRERFGVVKRTETVRRNVPPAAVHACRAPRGETA